MPTLNFRNLFLKVRCSSVLICFLLISTSSSSCLKQDEISLYETLEHLMCAKDEGYINDEQFQDLNNQILECLKILNGYVQYLKKAKKST